MLIEKKFHDSKKTHDSNKKKENKEYNIFDVLSRRARKFLKFFMWKIISLLSQRDIRNLKEENAYENVISELKKPKVIEIFHKGKRIMINLPESKDVHVLELKNILKIYKFYFNVFKELKIFFRQTL